MAKSIFDPSSSVDNLGGGLDTFLGPAGQVHSNMPEELIDGDVDTAEAGPAADPRTSGQNAAPGEAVTEIKQALDELHHADAADEKQLPPDGPG